MRALFFLFLLLPSLLVFGQRDRSYIKNSIRNWGTCKNVAITRYGGDVALGGRNAYSGSKVPATMLARLKELNAAHKLIDEIVLTEEGAWFILFGNNGYYSEGCPASMLRKLREWNQEGEVINSVSFNDRGDWIIISNTKYAASSSSVIDWLTEGSDTHGELWVACLTDTGLVAVYARGYKFLGDVPLGLKRKLRETDINVYRLKFLADGSYFFADRQGRYDYYF